MAEPNETNCEYCDGEGCAECDPDNLLTEDFDPYESREEFADPGGNSALRAAGPGNPRDCPCPTCKAPNVLTRKDKALGYQCDRCADRAEHGFDY